MSKYRASLQWRLFLIRQERASPFPRNPVLSLSVRVQVSGVGEGAVLVRSGCHNKIP